MIEIKALLGYRLHIPMNKKLIKITLVGGVLMFSTLFGLPVMAEETKNNKDTTPDFAEIIEVPDLVEVLDESLEELKNRLAKYSEQKIASTSIFDRFKLFWTERTLRTLIREVELYIEASLARGFIDLDTADGTREYIKKADAIIN